MTLTEIKFRLITIAEKRKRPCAYNHGLKTAETRAAACLYIKLRRAGLLEHLKAQQETPAPTARKKISERANPSDVNQLVNWMTSKYGRQAALARQLGVSACVVEKVKNTGTCTQETLSRLKTAQQNIIKLEKKNENKRKRA
ncbi:hypothetical protein KTJ63_03040 [Acinetobacter baumannii]|nr:hypothetical protein [Acinetobacter baumannii]HCA4906076.1 hypothetical protein [Acinetobacter baumannii]